MRFAKLSSGRHDPVAILSLLFGRKDSKKTESSFTVLQTRPADSHQYEESIQSSLESKQIIAQGSIKRVSKKKKSSFVVLRTRPADSPPYEESNEAMKSNQVIDQEHNQIIAVDRQIPWEISFDRNLRNSPILRLPDELLLQMMKIIERDDLYMLRQVSFTLWRIYQDRAFKKFHRLNSWEIQHRDPGFEKDEKTVLRAKSRAFCAKCLERRSSSKFNSDKYNFSHKKDLYCSSCEMNHERILFSFSQRQNPPETRRCIASETGIRLCYHITVPAASIRGYVDNLGDMDEEIMLDDFGYTLESCDRCKALALTKEPNDSLHITVRPPTLSLLRLPYVGEEAFQIWHTWQLPLFSMAETSVVTIPFLLQKFDEFENTFGQVFCDHFNLHDGQILRALDPLYCNCLGGDSRVGNLVPFDRDT